LINLEIVAVIPARFASTRLPGKPLLSETGRPLIQHVVEAARQAKSFQRIIVATDDERIADAVSRFGGEAMMTRADHATGTDRVAEIAARLETTDVILNLQGDEPEIAGETLDQAVALLVSDPDAPMATLATPIHDESVYRDPSCVKVVINHRNRALYFSRSPIPHHRDGLPGPASASASGSALLGYLHLGLYAYRREFLLNLGSLPRSPLEAAEKLEQLRVLEAGFPIAIGIVDEPSIGIDTPEDYRRFVERWHAKQIPPLAKGGPGGVTPAQPNTSQRPLPPLAKGARGRDPGTTKHVAAPISPPLAKGGPGGVTPAQPNTSQRPLPPLANGGQGA